MMKQVFLYTRSAGSEYWKEPVSMGLTTRDAPLSKSMPRNLPVLQTPSDALPDQFFGVSGHGPEDAWAEDLEVRHT